MLIMFAWPVKFIGIIISSEKLLSIRKSNDSHTVVFDDESFRFVAVAFFK